MKNHFRSKSLDWKRSLNSALEASLAPLQSLLSSRAREICLKCKSHFVTALQKTVQWLPFVLGLLLLLLLSRFSRVRLCATPQTRQPTRIPCPWDFPGKNTGVGCHFLLQCMKVKSARSRSVVSDSLRPHGLHPTYSLQISFSGKPKTNAT